MDYRAKLSVVICKCSHIQCSHIHLRCKIIKKWSSYQVESICFPWYRKSNFPHIQSIRELCEPGFKTSRYIFVPDLKNDFLSCDHSRLHWHWLTASSSWGQSIISHLWIGRKIMSFKPQNRNGKLWTRIWGVWYGTKTYEPVFTSVNNGVQV